MRLGNQQNPYAAELGASLDSAPKAVIAAIAVSLLSQGGEKLNGVEARFLQEWWSLYRNKIVTQKPTGKELHHES